MHGIPIHAGRRQDRPAAPARGRRARGRVPREPPDRLRRPRSACGRSSPAPSGSPSTSPTGSPAPRTASGSLPCVTQYGPGAEAAFGAVAQAYGDRSPILLLPDRVRRGRAGRGPELPERAGLPADHALRRHRQRRRGRAADLPPRAERCSASRNGPVLVAVANDVMNGERGDADWDVRLGTAAPDAGRGRGRRAAARRLAAAANPVILAGQGVLYADATAELVELAELTGVPVATTLNGKSAFPENHPLALGHRRPHPARDGRRVLRPRRPDPRHRHQLHPLALHHAACRIRQRSARS